MPLWDELEQYFASDEVKERVRQLQAESDLVLDNDSKDRALVGDVISTVALPGQIIEEYSAKLLRPGHGDRVQERRQVLNKVTH